MSDTPDPDPGIRALAAFYLHFGRVRGPKPDGSKPAPPAADDGPVFEVKNAGPGWPFLDEKNPPG